MIHSMALIATSSDFANSLIQSPWFMKINHCWIMHAVTRNWVSLLYNECICDFITLMSILNMILVCLIYFWSGQQWTTTMGQHEATICQLANKLLECLVCRMGWSIILQFLTLLFGLGVEWVDASLHLHGGFWSVLICDMPAPLTVFPAIQLCLITKFHNYL